MIAQPSRTSPNHGRRGWRRGVARGGVCSALVVVASTLGRSGGGDVADPAPSPLGELISVLVRQARLLEDVDHRVVAVSVLVDAHEGRFLSQAADDLEIAAGALAELDTQRDEVAVQAAHQLGVATTGGVRLRAIAAAAAGPERAALDALGERLEEATARIDARIAAASQAVAQGLRSMRDLLESRATGSTGTLYGRDGAGNVVPPPSRFDERA